VFNQHTDVKDRQTYRQTDRRANGEKCRNKVRERL